MRPDSGQSEKDPSLEAVTFQGGIRSTGSGAVLIWERSGLEFMISLQSKRIIELMFGATRVLIDVKGERLGPDHLMDKGHESNRRLEVQYPPAPPERGFSEYFWA